MGLFDGPPERDEVSILEFLQLEDAEGYYHDMGKVNTFLLRMQDSGKVLIGSTAVHRV